MKHSYVDAYYNREKDLINVVERDTDGKRHYQTYPARHVFYYPDPRGKYRSMKGEPLSRCTSKTLKEHRREVAMYSDKKLYESDINPIFRCLEDNYLNIDPPALNIAFYDIEVDFDPERGYASTDDPFMPITAISVHLQWLDTLICLAIPPKTVSMEEANKLIEDIPNTVLFENEADMLNTFLDLIQEADIISGWNSEGFDIPYTVNRITKVLSKDDTRRLCLWDNLPKKREYEKYGKTAITYDLVGRVHLDSLELYRKYTYEERHSYRLDAIAEYELGDHKTQYDGTLDQLYNHDFRKFIEYSRQDTALLDKLDKKLKFISLANSIAHENTVLLQTTMGAVAVTEQAIINETHRMGLIAPSRAMNETIQAAGAYVAYPKKGIHKWIGSLDINSLYPSAIRALNMGPETIIGQLRQDSTVAYIEEHVSKGKSFAAAWEGMFGSIEYSDVMEKKVNREVTIDWEDGGSDTLSAAQAYTLIFESNQPWMLSANGTIFTYEKEGIIPGLLKRWYSERKELQAKLKDAIKSGNKIEEEYWDKRQLVKKINLNSLYGAILNPGCRFFDKRIGQSTTLTGRQIAKHMASKVNEIITGEYDHTGKSIIYGDSVTGDTMILTNNGETTIADLFNRCVEHSTVDDKEYGVWSNDKVVGFNSYEDSTVMANISCVMRHKTKKQIYKITLSNGKHVKVTEDHSAMVDRDGFLIEVKPADIQLTDLFVCLLKPELETERVTVQSVESLGEIDDYVYDISIADQDPFFFANDILVHNTDSCYFSAYTTLKNEIDNNVIPWSKDAVVELYDTIGETVNDTFPQFMQDAFHCPKSRGEVIKAGREIVASNGLFITKKRYAVLYYDKEGKRTDVDGKNGKIKAMGLDLKRSDTPVVIQDFLSEVLTKVLSDVPEADVLEYISTFRKEFKSLPGWEKGSPKRANKITQYRDKESKAGKANMPGHVRASLNWNTLKRMYDDKYSMNIVDGAKVIVCKLRDNPMGFTSVAYPVDELRLPQWFRDLPFADSEMENTVIDEKLSNLIGVLNWDLQSTTETNMFKSLFDF